MDLESFYEKEFSKYEESPDNFCNICFCEHDDTSVKLKCGHKYHYSCIKDSYVINNTKKKRCCPYCRKDGGYLSLINDEKPIKGIHREYQVNYKRCIGIIMNGENANTRCTGKCNFIDEKGNLTEYCKRHKSQFKKNISETNELELAGI